MNYSLKLKIRHELGVDKNGECAIHIQYIYARKRIFLTTNQKINPTFWDVDLDKPLRTYPGYKNLANALNLKLDQVEKQIENYFNEYQEYPSTPKLKVLVNTTNATLTKNSKDKNKLTTLWKAYLEEQKNKKVKFATLEIYRQTWDKWLDFCQKRGEDYTYLDIKFELFEGFKVFLLNKGYQKNTRGKAIKTIKAFFNYLAITKELPINPSYKRVSVEKEELDIATFNLTEIEILKREVLYSNYPDFTQPKFELTDYEQFVGRVMVFLCNTGLSFVDFDSLRLKHIVFERQDDIPIDVRLELVRTKVDSAKCVIPILDSTIDIIALSLGVKYYADFEDLRQMSYEKKVQGLYSYIVSGFKNGTLSMSTRVFQSITSQRFNKDIKDVLRQIKIDAMVSKIVFKGKQKEEQLIPKYKLVSSITGRRTYVTLSFENGNDATIIMKTTGHAKIETMNRYNKVSASQIQAKIKKNTPSFKDKDLDTISRKDKII